MLVLFNVVMLGLDAAAIAFVAALKSRAAVATAVVGGALAMLGLIAITGEGEFSELRLLCCGLFIHGPLVALAMFLILYRTRRIAARVWLALGLLLAVIGFDAFYIEPYWLQVTHLTLRSPKIEKPLRLAVIADLQTDTIGEYERDLFARVLAEKPDAILFAGDYIQVEDIDAWIEQRDRFRKLLAESGLTAPLGVFAVKGNTDPVQWDELFEGSKVRLFHFTEGVRAGELLITGLSEEDSKNHKLQVAPSDAFQIALGHYPDYALGDVEADLMLAGHTHGGQVRLPLIGPMMTLSRVPRNWAAGLTDRGGGKTLIVSRGAGMERGNAPRLRFLCRPELIIIDLAPPE